MHLDAHPVLSAPSPAVDPLWQNLLGLLLESTGEGVFGIDLDGNCTFLNRAGGLLLGWDPAEVLGRNMHVLTHHSHPDGGHYPVEDCPIFNAFREARPCRIDAEVFWRRDGTAFAVEYSSYPILDGAQVRGAVVTLWTSPSAVPPPRPCSAPRTSWSSAWTSARTRCPPR